ncbi:GntR family transcriptional regulator [Micromonospora sp. DT4]|uniref:GntR family transcriptional regulator n=1 Tax=Micromonospora sp. DT4 TaxID=3393438 RepID=UPI003CF552B2
MDLAVSRLTRDILSGKSDPGERLVEEQLTGRLGISRGSLREALRLLAQQGLVEYVPRRGVRVATLSDRVVRELYELRTVRRSAPSAVDGALRGVSRAARRASDDPRRRAAAARPPRSGATGPAEGGRGRR